jgi:predicted acyl esterase
MNEADLGAIHEIENTWIPMPDGARLAARIFCPRNARQRPVPAILEYLPYRKRDFMRARDEPIHRWFAMNGYASVRVDVRGTGDSDGILDDEYSPRELADALSLLDWIAAQPWCSGAVGMMGISWGGFNALQVAALQPPALKAVIALCSSDDRYADDAHYMGGCLLNENLQWGSILMANCALPPDPLIVGEGWRATWRERVDALPPFPAVWMGHQWRDSYWRHGSVCEDYAAIRCPVYAVGGWADAYTNAVPRLVANLACPRKGLIGPWAHTFPHNGVPGPAIGFLQEAKRWWDHWLRGVDTGIMDEPVLRVWLQEHVSPQPQYAEWPGRWVAETEWPSPRIAERRLFLDPGQLCTEPEEPTALSFSSPQTTGFRAGEWCAFGADGEMPRDQRTDDGNSLVFDTDPLAERLEVLGAPVAELELSCDRAVAMIALRLSDVAPDGSALRVSYGLLNLAQRESRAAPEPLVAGEPVRVRLQLNDAAHAFPPGHRIRLAVSTSYWPIAWPAPEPVTLTLQTGVSSLALPVRPTRAEDAGLKPFEPPVEAPSSGPRRIRPFPMRRTLEIDLTTNEATYSLRGDAADLEGAALARLEDVDLELGSTMMRRYRIIEDQPLSAQAELATTTTLRRGEWHVWIDLRTRLTATRDHFQFTADLACWEGSEPFAERHWVLAIPRRLV